MTSEVNTLRVLAFRVGEERYLVRLDAVRAVVRLRGLRRLRGCAGALIGVLDVQQTTVAIYDARPVAAEQVGGDVLVLAAGWPDHAIGVACDGVEGLLELGADDNDDGGGSGGGSSSSSGSGGSDGDDHEDGARATRLPRLPDYVEALLRVDAVMLPLVDAVGLAEATSAEAVRD